MNERTQPGYKNELASSDERVNRFHAIWKKTNGSHFKKTCAMLEEYSSLINWGTYRGPVSDILQAYEDKRYHNNYVGGLEFDLGYLLFLLSEKILFSDIKPQGDLAAIFHVIFNETGINPHDFNQGTELYFACQEYKDALNKNFPYISNWAATLAHHVFRAGLCNVLPRIDIFFKAKLINHVDRWKLIVNQPDVGFEKWIAIFESQAIEKNEFKKLFKRALLCDAFFAQYLFCKYHELDISGMARFGDVPLNKMMVLVIQKLCELTNKKIDGDFLAMAISEFNDHADMKEAGGREGFYRYDNSAEHKNMVDGYWYDIWISVMSKIDFIEGWDSVLAELVQRQLLKSIRGVFGYDEHDHSFIMPILSRAIVLGDVEAVKGLLKTFSIDIKDFVTDISGGMTPIQYALHRTIYKSVLSEKPEILLQMIEVFIKHDPACVKIKDGKGCKIFSYLPTRTPTDKKIHAVISSVYFENLWTFFTGKKDNLSSVKTLNNDVLNVIAANTMRLQ